MRIVSDDPAERLQAQVAIDDLVPYASVGASQGGRLPFGPDSVNLVYQGRDSVLSEDDVRRVLAQRSVDFRNIC